MERLPMQIFLSVMIEMLVSIRVNDAYEYRKSKTRIRKEKKQLAWWRRFLRIYPKGSSYAPRHMKIFMCCRVANIVIMIIAILACVLVDQYPAIRVYLLWEQRIVFIIFVYLACFHHRRGGIFAKSKNR